MKTFTLTVDIPANNVRDSVHVAQVLREAAATLEYQAPLKDHLHVYGSNGSQKYEWTAEEVTEPVRVAIVADDSFPSLAAIRRYTSLPQRAIEGAIGSLADLPRRAFEASEERRLGGIYNPAPAVETAMMTMGTGAFAGAPMRAGETVLGSGPVRKIPMHAGEIDPNAKVNLGEVYRGTEGAATAEEAARRAGLGDIGHGVYVTPSKDIAGSYGGGSSAKLSDKTRAVHSFDAGSLYPEDVAYIFGGKRVGEHVQLVSGNGIPLWSGPWSGANIENALKDSGVKAVLGTPNSIGINQIAIRDPSILKIPR